MSSDPQAPDGGWGWLVVAAYFFISVIMDGIRYSFGVLYVAFLDSFGQGHGETAFVSSLMVGSTNFFGPVAGRLTDVFGCRIVCIVGAIISAVGFLLSCLADSLFHLYLTFGILAGIGNGMMFMASVVSVSRYFDKRRSFAMGLAVCGSGVGTMVFSPLTERLLDTYGWRGTVMIEAGLLLNCVVFGAVYRPVEVKVRTCDTSNSKDFNSVDKKESHTLHGDQTINRQPLNEQMCSQSKLETAEGEIASRDVDGECLHSKGDIINCEVDRDSSFQENSGHVLLDSEPMLHSASSSNSNTKDRKQMSTLEKSMSLFGCHLLQSLNVWIIMLVCFVVAMAYNTPYTFLPDLVQENNFSDTQAALVMSAIGISNTIGRVAFGWVADRPGVNGTLLFSGSLVAGGIFSACCPLFTTFPLLIMYAIAFGLSMGGYVTLSIPVLTELFGVDVITQSAGLFLFSSGIASFLGSPVAGWLFDGTGSYQTTFIVTGLEFCVGGLIMLIPIWRQRQLQRQRQDLKQTEVVL